MKKRVIALLCCLLLLVTSLTIVGCSKKPEEETSVATSYVTMDINPSIELVVDQNNKVISVSAANEDGDVMLYGETGIVGVDVSDASNKILDLAVEYGFLTESNSGVSVSVVSDKSENEETISNKISASIETKSAAVSFDISFTTDDSFSIKRQLNEYVEKYPELTGGQLKLILKAQACDPSLKFDDAYNMTTEELLAIVETKKSEVEEYCNTAYQKAVAAAQESYSKALDIAKATALSTKCLSYVSLSNATTLTAELAKYPLYIACDYALQDIIVAMEYVDSYEVTPVVVDAIAEKLELTDVEKNQMKNDEGKYTIESIENYLDKLIKNASADAKVELEAKYADLITIMADAEVEAKANNELIKGETLTMINSYLSQVSEYLTEINITIPDKITLDDLKDMQVKFADGAKASKENIYNSLSDKQKEELDEYMLELEAEYEDSKAQMEQKISEAKAAIEQEIAARKEALKAKEE